MGEHLLLDPSIRDWVLFPVVIVTMLVGIGRGNLSRLMRSEKAIDLDKLKHTCVLAGAAVLMATHTLLRSDARCLLPTHPPTVNLVPTHAHARIVQTHAHVRAHTSTLARPAGV